MVRHRDVVAGLVREPVTWLRQRIMMIASTDPASLRHRVAAVLLTSRGPAAGGRGGPALRGQRGVANTTMLSR